MLLTGPKFWMKHLRPTGTDLALTAFLATAAMGVWTAYDRPGAWERFLLILAGTALGVVIARTPPGRLSDVADAAGALGAGMALVFLLTIPWGNSATELSQLKNLANWWPANAPSMALPPLAPDRAAGLLAVLVPLCLVSAILTFRRRAVGRWLVAGSLTLMILGLLATSSRAAWVALLAGAVAAAWAGLWRRSGSLRGVGRIALVLAMLLIAGLAWGATRGLEDTALGRLADLLASPDGVSRLTLARDTLDLIGDFPLTGAGLGSFPGLYSRYILAIPQPYLDHAHNLYLDIALSQGALALVAFAALLLGGMARSASGVARENGLADRGLLQWAAFAGLIVLAVYGLVDDPLENGVGLTLLFLYPAMTISLQQGARSVQAGAMDLKNRRGRRWRAALLVGTALFGMLLLLPSTRSAWYANLGALEMARQELEAWPAEGLLATEATRKSQAIDGHMARALELNPESRTALHRIGLLEGAQGDWDAAIAVLERARRVDPSHRGIRKLLGYAYTWKGDLEPAEEILASIPEARAEMEFYAWWWAEQGSVAQAQRAREMLVLLEP